MKILHVYSGNLYGGIETVLVTLARHRALSPELTPAFELCFDGRLRREHEAAAVEVHELPAPRASHPLLVRRARRALAEVLARDSFDGVICHAAWSQAFFGSVVRRAGVPLIFWAHDAVTGRHWTERLARRVVPDLAVCNSGYTAAALTSMYPGVPSVVIANPIDLDRTTLSIADRDGLRRTLDTTAASTVIIQTSRLEPWKGHGVLIDALAQLATRSDWTCWIAGGAQRPREVEYAASLCAQAARLGIGDRVRWLGERQDVRRLLAAADIHCQPNTGAEPFGIAFVEALAAGLPVVATRLGGALEIVDDRCGRLVPAGDASALAGALTQLIDDPPLRRCLADAARARARQVSDPGTQMRKLFDALAPVSAIASTTHGCRT